MVARSLTLRHMAKTVQRSREGEVTDPAALGPDQMKLYSFYKPSLLASDYVIEAKQSVTANTPSGTQSLDISNTRLTENSGTLAPQEFEVVVPRFSLDPGLINSYYPPDGHQDEGRILPHIVFNDPHYPWEIPAGVTQNMDSQIDPQTVTDGGTSKEIFRGMVPWVALLVFDPGELHLPTLPDLTALNIPGFTQDIDVATQNPNGTFAMKVSEYFSLIPQSSRINYRAGYVDDDAGFAEITSDTSSVSVIFPTKELFNQILTDPKDTDDHKVGVESRKYLSHVRHINTVGFPDAGVEEEGLFSIILSSRTGAFDITQPSTQVCHLVAIEHVDSTLGAWMAPSASNRIGMISLFSWIYSALPPDPVNFIDTMRNLTLTQQMLRTDDSLIAQMSEAAIADGSIKSQAAKIMADRLNLGYTIARWRTQSGEESVAFNRGPLVPQPVTWPPAGDLPDCSNTSQEYQILDAQTGIMDLSYSSAWQTGKLLAISDSVFSAALMRFRSQVRNSSADQTRRALNGMSTKRALVSSIKNTIVSIQTNSVGQTGEPQRVIPPRNRSLAPGMTHPATKPTFLANVKDAVSSNANAGQDLYNEFNLSGPNNSDWAVILAWMCDKLSLEGIPPQYIFPEPSSLKPESLRFFHIDDFWLDCLLDGALSVANHLDGDDDIIRRAIKETFNVYLRTVVSDAGYKPQIPCYGFIMRSKLIRAMPDLRITVTWETPDNRAPVCRWTKWDSEALICLLDRQPQELASITLAQPAHQQRFSLGSHLSTAEGVTFSLRTLYTQGAPNGMWPEKGFPDSTLSNTWFDFQTRCLKLNTMAPDLNKALQFGLSTDAQAYIDPVPNACEFGLCLNDPSYFFEIVPPSNAVVPPRDRQLFVQETSLPSTVTGKADLAEGVPKAGSIPSPAPRKKIAITSPTSTMGTARALPRPPHQQLRMQAVSSSNATKPGLGAAGVSTVTTKFTLTIFPDYKGLPTRYPQNKYDPQDYIPTNNVYFFDLIFSIRKSVTASASQYKLLRLDIDVPIAPSTNNTEVLLDANYDGPGLRMLSNQRFTPFLFNNSDGKLHFELIPRSANDDYALTINDRKSEELGFRLAEANISPVVVSTFVDIVGQSKRQERGLVVITMTEWYATAANPTGEPVSSTYNLIKWQTQDDSI